MGHSTTRFSKTSFRLLLDSNPRRPQHKLEYARVVCRLCRPATSDVQTYKAALDRLDYKPLTQDILFELGVLIADVGGNIGDTLAFACMATEKHKSTKLLVYECKETMITALFYGLASAAIQRRGDYSVRGCSCKKLARSHRYIQIMRSIGPHGGQHHICFICCLFPVSENSMLNLHLRFPIASGSRNASPGPGVPVPSLGPMKT